MERISGGILTATLAATAALLCGLPGCGNKQTTTGPQMAGPPVAPMTQRAADAGGVGSPSGAGGDTEIAAPASNTQRLSSWPFRPTSLRLHPLTHAIRTDGHVTVLEARVEYFDRFGHTTKGLGVLRFELHDKDRGRRLGSWQIDVMNVDANMRHYDDVTRTYLFRLDIESLDALPDAARLEVTVVTPTQRLSDSIDVSLR